MKMTGERKKSYIGAGCSQIRYVNSRSLEFLISNSHYEHGLTTSFVKKTMKVTMCRGVAPRLFGSSTASWKTLNSQCSRRDREGLSYRVWTKTLSFTGRSEDLG
jgi:hypothetical protein